MNGQMDFCAGRADSSGTPPVTPTVSSTTAAPMVEPSSGTGRSAMSSTGTWTLRSQRFGAAGAMISTGRSPPRKSATASSGRTVADSPMRCGSRPVSRESRSSESARCAPRLVPARAWISSTMTVSTSLRIPAAFEVSIR